MRKLFFFAAAAAMLTTACSKDEAPEASGAAESVVTFTVTAPNIGTRAASTYGNGHAVNMLHYAVYLDGSTTPLISASEVDAFAGNALEDKVSFTLANGKSYDILFWADNDTAPYDVNWNAQTVTINNASLAAQNENMDAFFKKIDINNVQGPINQTVELKRPFAQLNIATKDTAAAETAGVVVGQTAVTVKAYKTLNLASGAVSGQEDFTYNMAAIPTDTQITAKGTQYDLLSMNYLLVNTKELVDVQFSYADAQGNAIDDATYEAVPVERNYKTHIVGDLLTNQAKFDVIIKPDTDGDDHIYDGPVTVADAAAANTAFENGATSVTIDAIATTGTSTEIILPETQEPVSLFIPDTTEPLVITAASKADGATGTETDPAVLNLNVPNGDISKITFNMPNTTVYVNGVLTDVTAYTANNTLYVTAGTQIENLVIGKGNVVIEKGASVKNISRSNDNNDDATVVYYYNGEATPATTDSEISFEVIVAEVDGKFYSDLAAAVAAADGKTIKVLDNINVDADNTITIPADKTMTLDLNGFTVAGVSDNAGNKNRVLFDVRGTLNVQNGTVTFKHEGGDMEWNAMIEPFYVGFNGTLNVKDATIENFGGSAMAYCIDLVNATNITVNVENSTLKSTYIPVRVFNNGSGMNNVKIENSTLDGKNCFWVHIFTTTDNGGKGVKPSTLNLDIYNNNNTFKHTSSNPSGIFYGFSSYYYYDETGKFIAAKIYENADLDYALKNATADTVITLGEGEFDLSGATFAADKATIVGADKEKSIVKIATQLRNDGKVLTLKNLTVNVPTGLNYTEHTFAFIHYFKEFNMIDCISNGRIRTNSHKVNIDNCVFNVDTSSGFDGYAIYYYGADKSQMTVSNSTFNTVGKAIVMYNESAKVLNMDVNKCTFISSATTEKAAIQMHTELGINGTLDITECTATGFADVNGGLWNELNNNTQVATDNFDITVDGTQVH